MVTFHMGMSPSQTKHCKENSHVIDVRKIMSGVEKIARGKFSSIFWDAFLKIKNAFWNTSENRSSW